MAFCGFQSRLKKAKYMAQMNNTELARACGVERKAVSHWCSGKSYPNAERVYHLACALGVSADWLLGTTDRNWLIDQKADR